MHKFPLGSRCSIVAAELTNCVADSQMLLAVISAVKDKLGEMPAQTLADAGFRSEAMLAKVADNHGEALVALGREGKDDATINATKYPHTAAMAAKLKTAKGDAADRRRKAIVEPPNAWIKALMDCRSSACAASRR